MKRDEEGKVLGVYSGVMQFGFGSSHGATIPWPAAVPRNVPIVRFDLPASPAEVPAAMRNNGFKRWIRLLGEHGSVSHALMREDGDGAWTIVGEGILDLVDPAALRGELDEADRAQRALLDEAGAPSPWAIEGVRVGVVWYRCFDDGRRQRTQFSIAGSSFSGEVSVASLDGDAVRWQVTRVVRRPSM